MNTENMEQSTTTATPAADQAGGQKTFSQDDLNRIIGERLMKDRERASGELEKKEQELADREFRLNSRQKLIDRGYPESILEALNCSSEEAFNKALDALDGLMKERGADEASVRARQNAAVFKPFTAPHRSGGSGGPDPIREAMKL